ncbi:hypothetical protein PRIPAC_83017 [Pristionchus pacificus]|uniref:G protein-coupled receptor n=1 Tax=Pristionchus pacificus TaxID=54126 RepID=A0A2A6C3H6_PRIPA|nr:hypothetical protein PRIPAC_83017 [Pristionchus pacificus]|eukprot:PDM72657.1 G protein-coupled receptor [Pristionchus pacificus]
MTVSNSPLFLAAFIHRHQAVMAPYSRWSFSNRVQNIPPLIFALLVFIFPLLLQRTMEPPGAVMKHKEMLSSEWPSSLLNRTDCFYNDRLLSFSIMAAIGLVIGMIFVSLIISHTFATLKEKSTISEKMKEYHRTMTRVLLLQSGIPTLFALVPLSVCFSVFFLNLNGILIIPTCFVCMSAHSFLHSLAVLFTTPIYRRQLEIMIRETDGKLAITAKQETSSVTPRVTPSLVPKFQKW